MRTKVIIMGAAGRDFHNFNVYFRDNANYEVVAFTATQIPNIDGRKYPASLAGKLYPKGIDIHPESDLSRLISEGCVEQVIFAYSDIPHVEVMHKASLVNACGADFRLMGADQTSLKAKVPVIAVCAVRTGSGKSQTTRAIASALIGKGKRVVAIRHPMPYGDLEKQAVQRFAAYDDLDKHACTIEEREEYEPHIDMGMVVYAGVDYEKILRQAEQEADVVLWDGGNNDTPFYAPDLHIVVADPHRAGHGKLYHPGETNMRMADVIIINKVDTADPKGVEAVKAVIAELNPKAKVVTAASPVTAEDPGAIKDKRVLVIEDGPTVTHGEMTFGAGMIAAENAGAKAIIDPRPFAVGSIKATFEKYSHLENVLPAMGYGDRQVEELEKTINASDCDIVVSGTPIDLKRILKNVNKPIVRVRYDLQVKGEPSLDDVLRGI
ncbi:MAG: cyclic 2,3-diphosphoglycerate synthase [Candidatus Thermoplasmatota archaeon]|nr:cyclic 2,3-diphosphoglycerate synthase [Candidatus Thermoplasmatota archaeon]